MSTRSSSVSIGPFGRSDMCGFIGTIGLRNAPPPEKRAAALESLRHRGPDAEGDSWGPTGWLGFRRLSILDLDERSDQPMSHPSGVRIVFNGEIYNYRELRVELEHLGHRFETSGDTEVLLHGWCEWGEDVFRRCNGMWAVAVLDPARSGVILARDRFGEKPLHIGQDKTGAWWFASEPAALRAAGVGSGRVDIDALAGLLVYGDTDPGTRTWFDGIELIPPGHIVHLDQTRRVERPYWSTADLLNETRTSAPMSDADVQATLERAVALRLRSDVSVGTSLSGGVDSASIVASIRAVDPDRSLVAFTASFPGHPGDEFDRAALVADRFDVDLHRIEPSVDGFLGDLDDLIRHQGAPFDMPSVYAQWCVMQAAAAAGVTVLLDGQGADETWGGYAKHSTLALLQAARDGHLATVASTLRSSHGRRNVRDGASTKILGYLVDDRVRSLLLTALRRRRAATLGPALHTAVPEDPIGSTDATGPLQRGRVGDLDRSILPRLLRYADRNSMAWSREVRLPFLDPEMVELGFRSSWVDGASVGWTKHQLRRSMQGRVPDEVLWRREKSAFDVPTDNWLAQPKLAEQIDSATAHLVELGVLNGANASEVNPWVRLSISRFIDVYRLELP